MRTKWRIWQRFCGFTILEALISTAIMGIIIAAGFTLYLNQQKQWVVQDQIVDAQQNVRVAMDEISRNARMAGCGIFPWGLSPIESRDTNPDTLFLRSNPFDCIAAIGKNVLSNELHTRDHPRCFDNGSRAYIWDYIGQYEWFTIASVDTNMGQGWYEIHAAQNLMHIYNKKDNPRVMVFNELKYYIDQTTDPDHPVLMRAINGYPAEVFAENVEDLQATYILNDGSITNTVPSDLDDIRILQFELQARTDRQDPLWTDDDHGDGYRRRTLVSKIDARNLGL
jgi:hypothetical protein